MPSVGIVGNVGDGDGRMLEPAIEKVEVEKVEVAIAILYQADHFLMQLRDDFPHILYPGHWGFFGGHLDPEEDADTAIRRELKEEISYVPPEINLFLRTEDERVIRNFYQAPLTVGLDQLQLNEGQDLGLCSLADIQRGYKYSEKLGEDRPLGSPHRQALLDFIASGILKGSVKINCG